MGYRILYADVPAMLENKVEELILKGWEPIGGVAIGEKNSRFMQAMVYKPKA